jgi:glutamate transport system substrate-binding protein
MCQWIVDTLTEAQDGDAYDAAFEATLGQSGVDTPEAPEMDACPE